MFARIFAIASDANYEPGLRALLNSLWAYYRGELAVFIYHRGFTPEALERLAAHPNRPHLFATNELPFPSAGMWEAKQQIFAHCVGRARCVYLLDADLVLASRVEDVFELAEQGKIVSSSDGGVQTFGEAYAAYGPSMPGSKLQYVNSGALCLDVNRHWDLAGLWAFASQYGSYSPRQGHPLRLPGHGDQGTFNALAALLNKGGDLHVLPEAPWCDSAQTSCVAVRAVTTEGCLEVWNVTQSAPQRLVHNTGPKWWTEAGRQHLQRFGDKLKCFEHFAEPTAPMVKNGHTPSNQRVLVGVCSCRRHAGKRQAVRETWAQAVPANVRVVFFVGEGAEPCEEETWQLPCADTYEALPAKVQTFFQQALQLPDWEHVFKCDDDTYVVLERLVRLLGTGEFIGSAESAPLGFASGGAGYLVSRGCAEIIAAAPQPSEGAEDTWVSRILQNASVKLTATTALQAYHQIIPNAVNAVVTAHWCSEELMRTIHAGVSDGPAKVILHSFHATHAAWSGPLTLLKGGCFLGGGAGPDGCWRFEDDGNTLCLKWVHWSEDRLHRSETGYANDGLRLEQVA